MQLNTPVTTASIGAVPTSRQVSAGANMTGGGALSADRTFNATVPTIPPTQFPFVAGQFYSLVAGYGGMNGTTNAANGTAQFCPFILSRTITLSDLGTRIGTLSVAGNIQLAIYAADLASGLPTGSELAKTGNISTTLAIAVSGDIVGPNVTLPAGLYYAAWNSDNATAKVQCPNTANNTGSMEIGSTVLNDLASSIVTVNLSLTSPLAFATWGDLTAAVFTRLVGGNSGVNLIGKAA